MRIKPAISEIHEHVRMMKTAKLLLPMDSLKVCAFTLPGHPTSQAKLHGALKLAKNLEFLQIYVQTEKTSMLALQVIEVLPDLPKVSSLQIVTAGCATCLPAACLQHITHLELGSGVYFDCLPSSLRSLAIQFLACKLLEGYTEMLAHLDEAEVPINITIHDCPSSESVGIPKNTQHLSLQRCLIDEIDLERSLSWRSAFTRLTKLQILCVSDANSGQHRGIGLQTSLAPLPKAQTESLADTKMHKEDVGMLRCGQ